MATDIRMAARIAQCIDASGSLAPPAGRGRKIEVRPGDRSLMPVDDQGAMATLALSEDIPTEHRTQKPPGRLVGRAAEMVELRALLDGARQGSGGALVLSGAPGIGKSALLQGALQAADGMRVLHGAGVESEAGLDYAGLHQLIWPLLARVDALPDVQAGALRGAMGRSDSSSDRLLVGMALLSLLS